MKPCIVVVGYNRPNCLKRLLKSISQAIYFDDDIPLVISLDKATNDNGCLEIANGFNWEHGKKIVRTFEKRLGLRNHILQCGDLSNQYGSVIVLEDDLVVSPMFYDYASKALKKYENDPIITGVSLYSHEWNGYANRFFNPILDGNDVYLGQFSITWGECWSKKWWNNFKEWYLSNQNFNFEQCNMPNNIKRWPATSWGKFFIAYMIIKNLFYIIPTYSMSTNCSNPGQHALFIDSSHQVRLLDSDSYVFHLPGSVYLNRYDVFFENISLKERLEKEFNETVTIDLNGKKARNYDSRYLLTTLSLNYKIIRHYGLQFRPIDYNVINGVDGNEIFLYDLSSKQRKPKYNLFKVLKYELRGYTLKDLFVYFWSLLVFKIKKRIIKE